MGIIKIKVKFKFRIVLIVIGDEVGILGELLKEGKIYDSNLYLLYFRLNEFGLKLIIYEIIGDFGERVSKRICEIVDNVDFIIIIGGVLVG